jgi:DNA-binding FrmR family transcriptional regulator
MKADKTKVNRLLKTAAGQIEGIVNMVNDDRYCMDISNQIIAVQAVLKRANREILKAHMQMCVKEAFEKGNYEEKIEEITTLIDKLTN